MRMFVAVLSACFALTTHAVGQEGPKVGERLAQLAGTWEIASVEGQGRKNEKQRKDSVFTIAGGQLTTKKEPLVILRNPKKDEGPFATDEGMSTYQLKVIDGKDGPQAIDLIMRKDIRLKGIYELKGDTLKLCVVNWYFCQDKDGNISATIANGKERPTDLTTKAGDDRVLYVLRRIKK